MPATRTPKRAGKSIRKSSRRDRRDRVARRAEDADLKAALKTLEAATEIERCQHDRRYVELADQLYTIKRDARLQDENAARKLQLERDNTRHLLKSQSLRHAVGLREQSAHFAVILNDVQKKHHDLLQATKNIAETRVAAALADSERYKSERFAAREENSRLKARLAKLQPPLVFPSNP